MQQLDKYPRSKTLLYIVLILINIVIFIYSIRYRYILDKLPRNIPFTLNDISFLSLISICSLYLLPFINNPSKKTINIEKLHTFLFPLYTLLDRIDSYMKENIYIKNFINNYIIFLIMRKVYLIKYYFIFYYALRFFILFVFIVDIFFYNCLFLTYKIV
jgi:hypothetical protein